MKTRRSRDLLKEEFSECGKAQASGISGNILRRFFRWQGFFQFCRRKQSVQYRKELRRGWNCRTSRRLYILLLNHTARFYVFQESAFFLLLKKAFLPRKFWRAFSRNGSEDVRNKSRFPAILRKANFPKSEFLNPCGKMARTGEQCTRNLNFSLFAECLNFQCGYFTTVRIILNFSRAFSEWETFFGITIIWPSSRMCGTPPTVISAFPSRI